MRESKIAKRLNIVATLKSSNVEAANFNLAESDELVVILESDTHPLYVFTHDIEFTQFVFANPLTSRSDPIEHNRESRTYTQYISNLIAAEASLNTN